MLSIYKQITGSEIDVKITDEVKGVFDRMLGAEPEPVTMLDEVLKRGYATKEEAEILRSAGLLRDIQNPLSAKQQKRMRELALKSNAEYQRNLADVKETYGKMYGIGDIVRMKDGSQTTVKEVRANASMLLENGRVVSPFEVERMAGQDNMFGDMGMKDRPDAVQSTLFQSAEEAGAGKNVKEAAKLWKEMGVRSPYFKNWFGDWEVKSNKSGDDNNGRVARKDGDGTSSLGRDSQGVGGMPDGKGLGTDSRSTRSSILRIIAESRVGDGLQGSGKAAGISSGVGIVDSGGEPAILYHGTRDLIDAFDPYHHNRKDFGWMGRGVYLTDDPNVGKAYSDLKKGSSKPTVMSLYAAVKNPFIADPIKLKESLMFKDQAFIDDFTDALKEQGYDGVVAVYSNGAKEIVAFYPEQVKSVNNRGTFDPKDPRILFQSADQPMGTVDAAVGDLNIPHASIMDEGYKTHIRPLLEKMREVAMEQVKSKPLDGVKDMSPEGQAMMRKYMQQVCYYDPFLRLVSLTISRIYFFERQLLRSPVKQK